MHRRHNAFTLTELLVALGVGMIVLNAAFVVFINTGKFFKRIESVGTKNDVAQSMILWTITQRDPLQFPQPGSGATPPVLSVAENGSVPQFRRIGAASFSSSNGFATIAIRDYSNYTLQGGNYAMDSQTKVVIQPIFLVVPLSNH